MKLKACFYLFIFTIFISSAGRIQARTEPRAVPAGNIEAEVIGASYSQNKKTGSMIFTVDTRLTNHSDTGIMEITYKMYFLDKNGEEMNTVTGIYNGQDTPLRPDGSVLHQRSGQFRADNKPKGITVEVLSVKTEEEMPPIHVPKEGDPLYLCLSDHHLENIKEEMPVSVKFRIDHGGNLDEAVLDSPEIIREFVDRFTQVRIEKEFDMWVTDNYNGISMLFSDGEDVIIDLNLRNLEYIIYGQEHIYTLMDDDPLWEMVYGLVKPVNY